MCQPIDVTGRQCGIENFVNSYDEERKASLNTLSLHAPVTFLYVTKSRYLTLEKFSDRFTVYADERRCK